MSKSQDELYEENKDILIEQIQRNDELLKSQKERAENKIIGYITILSLLITLAITTLTILNLETISKWYLLSCICTIYWSLATFIVSLVALKPRDAAYLNIKDLMEYSISKEKEEIKDIIVKNFEEKILDTSFKNSKTVAFYMNLIHIFLTITFIFAVIQLIFFILLII